MNHFECEHCHLTFDTEDEYNEHYCDRMQRYDMFNTPIGQSALALYKLWMSELGRPYAGEFIFVTSKHFKPLMKFVVYSRRTKLPKPSLFVKWATKRKLPPALWTQFQLYTEYLDYIDNHYDPIDATIDTLKTISNWCELRDIPTSQFFDTVEPYELFDMIQLRSISPFVLIISSQFKAYFSSSRLTQEQKIIINTIFKPDRLLARIESEDIDINTIKQIVATAELG